MGETWKPTHVINEYFGGSWVGTKVKCLGNTKWLSDASITYVDISFETGDLWVNVNVKCLTELPKEESKMNFTVKENEYKKMLSIPSFTYAVDRDGQLWYIGNGAAMCLTSYQLLHDRRADSREVKPIAKNSTITIET